MKIRMINGSVKEMGYAELCERLGFNADTRFVRITTAQTVSFSLGRPNEIRALKSACEKIGCRMSKKLAEY